MLSCKDLINVGGSRHVLCSALQFPALFERFVETSYDGAVESEIMAEDESGSTSMVTSIFMVEGKPELYTWDLLWIISI